MRTMTKTLLATMVTALALHGIAGAEDAPAKVKIKAWKADPVELCAGPDGKVVASKPASAMPMEAERVGQGWLKVSVGGKSYFVESSQARTDLKLSGKPKCESLDGATGHAASRGLGEQACEP
jgi:hypothetical protein